MGESREGTELAGGAEQGAEEAGGARSKKKKWRKGTEHKLGCPPGCSGVRRPYGPSGLLAPALPPRSRHTATRSPTRSCFACFACIFRPLAPQQLMAADSPSTDLAELLKLACKIFWSATYMEARCPALRRAALRCAMLCYAMICYVLRCTAGYAALRCAVGCAVG